MSQGRGPSGTIRKKEGRALPWFPVVRYYDDAGVRKERWLPGCKTEATAKRALRAALTAQDNKTWKPSTERLTVREYLEERWLPSLDGLRDTTVASYRLHVRAYIVPSLGVRRLDQVTGQDLGAFYAQLRKSGGKGGKALAPATVARVHATVSRAFRDAVELGMIAVSPARQVPTIQRPKQTRPGGSKLRYWTEVQLQAFLGGAEDHRLFPLLHLAAHTGMRRGELCGLRWEDVDLEGATLAVRQTRTSAARADGEPGTVVIVGEPKSGKGRGIALGQDTVAVLRAWRKRQAEERMAFPGPWPGHGLVFTTEDGQPPHPDTVSGTFDAMLVTSGLPTITLHGLRHTHATILLKAGVPVNVVQERLGHASATVTLNYYSHVMPDQQALAAASFAAALGGAGAVPQ
ncbi:tyrosine-type recombinase/integrase [Georgenia satyanarayanai]|uniref:tyrosine-type recombinase/integrase n=1 Tax=Georgenia satyanarayanai TaxID=860221 RepID=UPI00186B35AA|nr:tyrosine-type recombinase/integrase [Georgenia satyanarayanai]